MTSGDTTNTCPLCQAVLKSPPEPTDRDADRITCPRCGRYYLDGSFGAVLPRYAKEQPLNAALVSHIIRRAQAGSKPPFLDAGLWESTVANVPPPSPAEQAENLILWLGSVQSTPGEYWRIDLEARAVVGALSDGNFVWLLDHLIKRGVLEGSLNSNGATATLSLRLFCPLSTIDSPSCKPERTVREAPTSSPITMSRRFAIPLLTT